MRLIPNKDKLAKLVAKGRVFDLALYTEDSGNALTAVLNAGQDMLDDENTNEDVAIKAELLSAIEGIQLRNVANTESKADTALAATTNKTSYASSVVLLSAIIVGSLGCIPLNKKH